MTDDKPDESRRNVLKGAAATGVAATGLGAFGGTASAQQDIRELNVQVSDGLLTIQNVNVLRNVDIDDITVTVIGGDVNVDIEDVLQDINVDIEDVDINVLNLDDVLEDVDVLNDSVVQVAVAVLGESGDLVAAGSDAANL